MQQILILGGGFAGLWSAAGAARLLDQRGIAPDRIRVTLVNRDDWHSIRVRNYERDLADLRIPLAKVLEPIGVDRVVGTVTAIDVANRQVACEAAGARQVLAYDRLVLALGSTLLRPPIPGLLEHGFDIDTYTAAERLQAHIATLATRPPATGRYTAIVVGGGLTGIECATEIIATLSAASAKAGGEAARVILVDHAARVGSGMGDGACRVVETALAALGVEARGGVSVAGVTPQGLVLADGEVMPAATVVWCAGMRANALTETLPFRRDRLGRIAVDQFLAVEGQGSVFAAGDCADAAVDERAPLRHVVPARPSHGPVGRPQRGRQPARRADAAAVDRLVHDHPRSGRLGCRLYRGLGPPGGVDGGTGQADQDADQSPAHLSAALGRAGGHTRRRRSRHPDAAAEIRRRLSAPSADRPGANDRFTSSCARRR